MEPCTETGVALPRPCTAYERQKSKITQQDGETNVHTGSYIIQTLYQDVKLNTLEPGYCAHNKCVSPVILAGPGRIGVKLPS